MYLVELRPGKEELYRSVDELAAAISSGDVDVHSRIFHRATSKWISITLHPQFKAIAAARESEPLPPLPRKQWTFLTSATEELHQEHATTAESPAPNDSAPATESPAAQADTGTWRRPMVLGLAGLLLALGVQIAFSVPRPRWPQFAAHKRRPERSAPAPALVPASVTDTAPAAAPRSSVVSLASTAAWGQVSYPLPTATPASGTPVTAGQPAVLKRSAALPPAPAVQLPPLEHRLLSADSTGAVSVATLLGRYEAAYDEAGSRLHNVLRVVRLDQLFALTRLASDSLAALRLDIDGATNVVRAYRRREAEIEQSHQDTFAVLSRQFAWSSKDILRWYDRPSRKEPPAAAALTNAVLASADSVVRVLMANVGHYRTSGTSITFDRPDAAVEYNRLRDQFEHQLELARAARAEAPAGALVALLDALSSVRLPTGSSTT